LDKRIEDKKAMLGESNVLLKNAPDELPVLVSYYDEEIKRRKGLTSQIQELDDLMLMHTKTLVNIQTQYEK
jgi:hypothetical protein